MTSTTTLKRKMAQAKGWSFHRIDSDPDIYPIRPTFWRAMRKGVIIVDAHSETRAGAVEKALLLEKHGLVVA